MAEAPQSQNFLLPVVLIFALLFALAVFPPLGAMVGVLSPFPLVFIFLQRGKQVALVLIALVFAVLWFLVGPNQAFLFLAEYAVMALILGGMIQARFPGDWCIGVSAAASGLASVLLLMVLFGSEDTSVKDFFEKQIRAHFLQSMEAFEKVGENKVEIEDMKAFVEKTADGFASAYPAFVLIGSFVSALFNYGMVRIVWVRLYGPGLFSTRTFAEWVCPDNVVWGFIASSVALFLGEGMVADVGLNVFAVMLVIYFVQGTSIVVHFLRARNIPKFFWFVLFILIFAQPLLIGLVAGLGVFDIWADFRKLRNPLTSEEG